MASNSHNEVDERLSTYLDAAHACILDVGWRRTTLTEVARRAGVSRMTIYRSWPDMTTLLGDLMTREWQQAIVTGVTADGSLPERILAVLRAVTQSPLFSRILQLDPELLLPYLLDRRGRSQDAVLAMVEELIAEGQNNGTIRRGGTAAMARTLVLAMHGFALSVPTMLDDQLRCEDLEAELIVLIASYLEISKRP